MATATMNDQAVDLLNQLIETCKDGAQGFRLAESSVKSPDLKQLFGSYAGQRAMFGGQLQAEVEQLGGSPEKSGSMAATLHRGWMNVKAAVTGHDECSILAECERGEDAALKAYEQATHTMLPATVQAMVQQQHEQIKEAHNRIHALAVACTHS